LYISVPFPYDAFPMARVARIFGLAKPLL
jgi:hypothetical protein